MRVGIDFHDTLEYNETFFFMMSLDLDCYVITGEPESNREEIEHKILMTGLFCDKLLMGFEYDTLAPDHFQRMAEHKYKHIKENNIEVYFDDNPYYVNYLRNKGITVFQTILSDKWMEKEDKYTNLQKDQFKWLS